MKHSIRFKITFILTTMIILIVFITWFINRTFLSDFYIHTKMNTLNKVYQEIKEIYTDVNETDQLSEEDTIRIEQLASDYNLDIYVITSNLTTSYPNSDNVGKREYEFLDKRIMEYLLPGSNPNIMEKKLLEEEENYFIFSLYDRQMDSSYIDLVGFFSSADAGTEIPQGQNDADSAKDQSNTNDSDKSLNPDDTMEGSSDEMNEENIEEQNSNRNIPVVNNMMVLLRANLESIEEGVTIANTFLMYVGILAAIVGSMVMLIFSKKFTKPILELAGIAKKISDLDFEVKYKIKTKDEIGELGSSINALSNKLETTIVELKQANNELLTDIQKKTEIDEMRKEFLSNVSHELKTPISLIQGYAEGLKENINDDPESRDFYCEVIMDEADKMNKMVKKLLNLNELEFGNNQINFERFDIIALIRTVLEATEILFKQKEITLIFNQMDPVYVWADEYMVEQVVTNYISNAINHIDGQKIIEIKLIPRVGKVRIAVLNTGENIPEEDIEKIWVKFFKVDKARTREYGGSGIGLSIVKAIMNSLNQDFGVINRSIGVEFWFELDTTTS